MVSAAIAVDDDLPAAVATRCVHHLFEEQVQRTPDSVALKDAVERLTYLELDHRSDGLAALLRSAGVGPEVLVGICSERNVSLVIGLLAILKAGGAYVPLDPSYPAERLAVIANDAAFPILLTQRRLQDRLPLHRARVLLLDAPADPVASGQRPTLVREPTPQNLAYVLYTSGSTGRPKGVAIQHASVVAFLRWAQRSFTPAELAGVLASTSLCFDLSVFELFAPLTCGGSAVLVENALGLTREHEDITLVNAVPSAIAELLRIDAIPPSVATINLAGEPLRHDLAQALHARGGRLQRVLNLYGPTEDTTYSTWTQVARGARDAPTIGCPIDGTQAHVLDPSGQPCDPGQPGELYLGGAGLARGYLNRPDQTADRFVPDPFSRVPGRRLYRTGDLVRLRHHGELQFLGRVDYQVKVRGYRVELDEVQAALAAHPQVRDAVVVGAPDGSGTTRLVAYVVAEPDHEPRTEDLRDFLAQTLPSYMVPACFIRLDLLPRTPNGKVDRTSLPAPDGGRRSLRTPLTPPSSTLESELSLTWATLLGLDRVGVTDDFFALGGHSLHAMRFLSRVNATYGVELSTSILFASPTIRAMADHIRQALGNPEPGAAGSNGHSRAALIDLQAARVAQSDGSESDSPPLTPAQQRFWFLNTLHPSTPAFNVPALFRLSGELDVDALRVAIDAVVQRHAPLRTSFLTVDGRPQQMVGSSLAVRTAVVDLRLLNAAECKKEADRLIVEEITTPFDLARGPLFRSMLLRTADTEQLLLLTIHHIATDGWSLALLASEISQAYRSLSRGEDPSFAGLPLQYADFARWQADWQRSPDATAQLQYWQRQLANLHVAELVTDRPRSTLQSFRPGRHSVRLPLRVTRLLKALGRSESATLYMTLLAALTLLLQRHTRSDDILVGSPAAGRTRPELEGLVGLFINNLVLRTDLSGKPTFRELLRRVRRVVLEAFANQDLPYERVLEALQPERNLGRNSLFQVLFNLYNFADAQLVLPGMSSETLAAPPPGSLFDLTIYARERDQRIELEIVYNADLFSAPRMSELLAQLATLIGQVAAGPDQVIDRYSLVTPVARGILPNPREPLFGGWSTSVDLAFMEQARQAPDRLALSHDNERWTYAELDDRSEQCGAWLRAAGVGPDDVVAVYTPRSAALVLSLLSVLKAGAAFLILDHVNPIDRLREQFAAAGARALIACDAAEAQALLATPDGTLESPLLLIPPGRPPDAAHLPARHSPAHPAVPHLPEGIAYIAYTSGSTGTPKAIVGTHRPLSHFIEWHAHTFGLTARSRFSMLSGLGHDPLLRDVFTPLWLGATLCIPSAAQLGDPRALLRWLQAEAVTVVHLTPVMGRLLLTAARADRAAAGLPQLRHVFFGGDRLSRADIQGWQRLAPGATIVNFYGATETPQAMGCWIAPAAGAPEPLPEVAPLGHGIDGVHLLVLNPAGGQAGIGEPGEIHVRTPYLSTGYLDQPRLTAERFVTNSATGSSHDRLFRTGDVGRYRSDGAVDFGGREDDQVKVRGFRVELGEVEATIRQHPAVDDVAVSLIPDHQAEPQLVAHLVTAASSNLTLSELRRWLRERLPEYMWPGAIVRLDQLPLTSNRKVDRSSLPPPQPAHDERPLSRVAPRGQLEQAIARVWAEALGIESPGADDNFFDIGGTSITMIRVHAALQGILNREISIVDLFRYPNVHALAGHLGGHEAQSAMSVAARRVRSRMDAKSRRLQVRAELSGGRTP